MLYPLMTELAAAEDITREAIHRIDLLDDVTAMTVGESRGEPAADACGVGRPST